MLVSPTEPAPISDLGPTSSVPERHGADIFWIGRAPHVRCGVQRKAFPNDFLASINDDRLSVELGQMQALDLAVLLLEGTPQWTTDGKLLTDYGTPWDKKSHRGYLWSVRSRGVWVETTDTPAETVDVVRRLVAWTKSPKHSSTYQRRGPRVEWGNPTNRDWARHFVQGLPGVGPELADRIINHFDGQLPVAWVVTREQLLEVKGVGPKTADRLIGVLSGV